MASSERPETHYTVFIKVPFPRGEFVDPAAVQWDSSKDRSLWKMLSSTSKGTEIDWSKLAEQFDVTLPFLLQQAAWLYELKLSQVREQLRRVNRPASIGASPTPPLASSSATVGAQPMTRTGSEGSRIPPLSIAAARRSPKIGGESSVPSTPGLPEAVPLQRTISTNTIRRTQRSSITQAADHPTTPPTRPRTTLSPAQVEPSRSPSPISTSPASSSSSDSSSPVPQTRSRFLPRRPRHAPKAAQQLPLSTVSSGSNSSSEVPAFLPFSGPSTNAVKSTGVSPHAKTASEAPVSLPRRDFQSSEGVATSPKRSSPSNPSQANTGPASSKAISPSHLAPRRPLQQPFPSISAAFPSSARLPLQPATASTGPPSDPATTTANPAGFGRPNANVSNEAQQQQTKPASTSSKNNSSPSTFSSFSSLDDDGMTKSALEEALLRQMDGGGSSGFSGLER